jgi:hypothetical protein
MAGKVRLFFLFFILELKPYSLTAAALQPQPYSRSLTALQPYIRLKGETIGYQKKSSLNSPSGKFQNFLVPKFQLNNYLKKKIKFSKFEDLIQITRNLQDL